MPTMITNEDGEPLGFDYPEYDSDPEEDPWYDVMDDDYEPDVIQDGFPYETDLDGEWN